MTREPAVLVLRDAEIPFGPEPGLRGVSLRVTAGQRVVLVGPSGVGKSTLLAAVAGEVAPTAGRIEICGQVAGPDPVRRQQVVLLDQRPILFPHLDVLDNVAFPLRVRGMAAAPRRRRALEALTLVGLAGVAARGPHTLSGGQAHRVALARALVVEPALLLLDEPLAALDRQLRATLLPAMLAAIDQVGPAVLMVTHDLDEAGQVGHRVGLLLDGRLAQLAPPADLFRHPATPGVAAFIGLGNQARGRVDPSGHLGVPGAPEPIPTDLPPGTAACALFGSAALRIAPSRPGSPPPDEPGEADGAPGHAGVPAQVVEVRPHPGGSRVVVRLGPGAGGHGVPGDPEGAPLRWVGEAGPELRLTPGDAVRIQVVPHRVHVFEDREP